MYIRINNALFARLAQLVECSKFQKTGHSGMEGSRVRVSITIVYYTVIKCLVVYPCCVCVFLS